MVIANLLIPDNHTAIYRSIHNLPHQLNRIKSNAWYSLFVEVVQNFLSNHKAEKLHTELVKTTISNLNIVDCNMSIKLQNHLDRFPQNLGDYSEE